MKYFQYFAAKCQQHLVYLMVFLMVFGICIPSRGEVTSNTVPVEILDVFGPEEESAEDNPNQLTGEESVLAQIKKTGRLTIAIREDSVPFGFRDPATNQWTGMCIDFAENLKQRLSESLDDQPLIINLYRSNLYNRFSLVREGVVVLECGPNTIQHDKQGITFSNPFLVTGTQILIRNDELANFTADPDLSGMRIGVLGRTTNRIFLEENYPQATLLTFQGSIGRKRGVQAVVQKKINGFASDGILLFGETLLLNIAIGSQYSLYPGYPLNCEEYGLILPDHDPEWREFVNQVISQESTRETYQRWIGPLLPALQRVKQYCEQKFTDTEIDPERPTQETSETIEQINLLNDS